MNKKLLNLLFYIEWLLFNQQKISIFNCVQFNRIKVALLEYSLEKGIVDEYHAFIKPNKIPLGYTSQCMDCSKEVCLKKTIIYVKELIVITLT